MRFDPESLPPLIAVPAVTLASPQDKSERKAGRTKAGAESQEPGKFQRPKQALTLDGPAYVERRDQSQPSTIDAITLQAGCSIRQGAAERKGPPAATPMTRSEFLQMKAARPALDAAPAAPHLAPQASRSARGTLQAPDASANASAPDNGRSSSLKEPRVGALKLSNGAGSSRALLRDGVSFRETAGVPRSPLRDRASLRDGAGSAPSPLRDRASMRASLRQSLVLSEQNRPDSPPDHNLALINAPDWGFSSSSGSPGASQSPPLPVQLPVLSVRRSRPAAPCMSPRLGMLANITLVWV